MSIKTGFFILLSSILISACSVNEFAKKPRYRYGNAVSIPEFERSGFARDEGRIVIFNAVINISVDSYDTLNRRLIEIAKKYDGYAVTLGNRRSTIRVGAEHLDTALKAISGLGKVKSKILRGDDVTEEYRDYEIRLENANKARQRYLELLSKAENVEAALKVEKELEHLNSEIELLKGKSGRLKHLADFSTIEINIEEKRKMGLLGYVGVGLYKGFRWLIVRS